MEILTKELVPLSEWFGPAVIFFLTAVPVVIVLGLFVCYLISAARHGPVEGFYAVARVVASAIAQDLPNTSLRRIGAITRLAIKEAVRRRVIVAFAIFALILLFAGWFLDTESDDPAHIYVSFVLTTTNFLALILALFLSIFSLPNDIKSRTIYTIVTKPVRAGELVFGRILGFSLVGTALLAMMCLASYVFVVRGLRHAHAIDPAAVEKTAAGFRGETTRNAFHRHEFTIGETGGLSDLAQGHHHAVAPSGAEGGLTVGPPEGMLVARVPIYGKLRFLDRDGNEAPAGVNVGKEWDYRSYIEGRTLHTAIWTFENLRAEDFPDGLPVAMTLSVFRTTKGNIEQGVRGVVILNNPNTAKSKQSAPISFESQEFATQTIVIPRKVRPFDATGGQGRELDVFDDLVDDGRLELWIRCDDREQYFGMAQADVYIQAGNAPFWMNFIKGYTGIWLQMLMVTAFGVMFSTFLNAPVAMLATLATIILGFSGGFVRSLWSGKTIGGGPIESTIRLIDQQNLTAELDMSPIILRLIQWTDHVFLTCMNVITTVLPNLADLGRPAEYVAYNFNVYGALIGRYCITTMVYVLAITIIGYFFMKTREIAA